MKKIDIKLFVLDITLKGGVERFVANMAIALVKHGFNVAIYSFHRTNKLPLYDFPPEVKITYLTEVPFRRMLYKFITLMCCIRMSSISQKFKSEYVVITTAPIITIFLSWFSPKVLSCTVASEHSTYSTHPAWIKKLRLLYYRGVKCVVTQTDDGALRFAKAGLPTAKIPNACTEFSDLQQWTLPKRNPDAPFICLSVGRFEEVKQLDHYIEMARFVNLRFPNIQFELVGAGPLENELRSRVDSCGLEKVFHIYPPTTSINKFYTRASIYVITSKSEAFPMTMIEALSYGVPVIAYDGLIGPKEVIIDGINGFLCEQDMPSAIAKKVIDIYKNRDFIQITQNNAVLSARAFKEDVIIDRWLEIIMGE